MAGINKAIIVGNIGKIETHTSSSGSVVVSLSVATSQKYTDKQGNQVDATEWHNIVAYKKVAEILSQYGAKGKKVYVEGPLKTEKYTKDGIDRYSTKIIAQTIQFLSPKDDGNATATKAAPKDTTYAKKDEIPFDDSIPF